MIEAAQKANEQRWAVFNALQRDFLGTPPIFEDSVGVYLLKEDGRMQPLAPQSWINDANAHQMLASGRDVSGSLLIVAEASLPGCCPSMTPPLDAAPPQTGEQAHDSAPESVAVELTSAPPAPDRRSVKEPSPPGPVPKPRARLEELTPAASPIAVQGQGGPKRRLYETHLITWLVPQLLQDLQRSGAEAKAKEFWDLCHEAKPDFVPLLPKRWRSMVNSVQRHIKNRRRQAPPGANKRQ